MAYSIGHTADRSRFPRWWPIGGMVGMLILYGRKGKRRRRGGRALSGDRPTVPLIGGAIEYLFLDASSAHCAIPRQSLWARALGSDAGGGM